MNIYRERERRVKEKEMYLSLNVHLTEYEITMKLQAIKYSKYYIIYFDFKKEFFLH